MQQVYRSARLGSFVCFSQRALVDSTEGASKQYSARAHFRRQIPIDLFKMSKNGGCVEADRLKDLGSPLRHFGSVRHRDWLRFASFLGPIVYRRDVSVSGNGFVLSVSKDAS